MATEDASRAVSTLKDLTSVCVTSATRSPLTQNDVRIEVTTELINIDFTHTYLLTYLLRGFSVPFGALF